MYCDVASYCEFASRRVLFSRGAMPQIGIAHHVRGFYTRETKGRESSWSATCLRGRSCGKGREGCEAPTRRHDRHD